ncbi:MAG: hypothetical protein DRJ52_02660 [Thermoprotei archaeon]|nr:MAG: hypothetical protein DRJ52_02660 [Thermoprotei archaeon]RLE96526.1 MAG: hypothetical protein DRJ63_10460 [Thermoprotei archaeon]
MYSRYLLDSSILIGFDENRLLQEHKTVLASIEKGEAIGFIHTLVVLEYAYFSVKQMSLREFSKRISQFYLIDVDLEDAYNAAQVLKEAEKEGISLSLSDALTIYYAKKMKVPIVSLKDNIREYASKIGLKVI